MLMAGSLFLSLPLISLFQRQTLLLRSQTAPTKEFWLSSPPSNSLFIAAQALKMHSAKQPSARAIKNACLLEKRQSEWRKERLSSIFSPRRLFLLVNLLSDALFGNFILTGQPTWEKETLVWRGTKSVTKYHASRFSRVGKIYDISSLLPNRQRKFLDVEQKKRDIFHLIAFIF